MSERIQLPDTFDFTKDITNITMNPAYIMGLEAVLLRIVTNMENPALTKPIFEKFENYISGKLNIETDPFNEEESILYTVYSLIQLLKAKAYEQGLNIKNKNTVSGDHIKDLLDATMNGDFDKLKEINAKMEEDIKDQLS